MIFYLWEYVLRKYITLKLITLAKNTLNYHEVSNTIDSVAKENGIVFLDNNYINEFDTEKTFMIPSILMLQG